MAAGRTRHRAGAGAVAAAAAEAVVLFSDWNAAVRQCPAGVPIFGVDLP